MTTHAGAADPAQAARFAAEVSTPPIAVRDIAPTGKRSDSFFAVDNASPVLVTSKPGEEAGWVALRLQNLSRTAAHPTVTFTVPPSAAWAADPIEHPLVAIPLEGGTLTVDLQPLEIRTVLMRFPSQLG